MPMGVLAPGSAQAGPSTQPPTNMSENKINVFCNTNNVGYMWTCKTCEIKNKVKVYERQISRSDRLRTKLSALNGKTAESFIYKHKTLEHEEEEMEDNMVSLKMH